MREPDPEWEQIEKLEQQWRRNAFQTGPCDADSAKIVIDWLYRQAGLSSPRLMVYDGPCAMEQGMRELDQYVYPAGFDFFREKGDLPARPDWTFYSCAGLERPLSFLQLIQPECYTKIVRTHAELKPLLEMLRGKVKPRIDERNVEDYRNAKGREISDLNFDNNLLRKRLDSYPYVNEWATNHKSISHGHGSCDVGVGEFGSLNSDHCLLLECCRIMGDVEFNNYVQIAEMEMSRYCGYWYVTRDYCFIADFPQTINLAGERLHCDSGPAVRFADGFEIYCLNGVDVPKEVINVEPDDFDPWVLFCEKNVEVRKEILKKIGVARLLQMTCAKRLDSRWGYDLYDLDIRDGLKRPYLKMVNPSTGEVHVEGVPPGITTVIEALRFRNGTYEKPVKVT